MGHLYLFLVVFFAPGLFIDAFCGLLNVCERLFCIYNQIFLERFIFVDYLLQNVIIVLSGVPALVTDHPGVSNHLVGSVVRVPDLFYKQYEREREREIK